MLSITKKTLKAELAASAQSLIEYAQHEEKTAKESQDRAVVSLNSAAEYRARAAEYQALADAQP